MRSFAGHADAPQDAAALIGTYDYMSPEQRRGLPATPLSDLFAIGMMMLRLLTCSHELSLRQRPSTLRPEIHPDWDDVIMTALREDPDRRFPDAATMAAAIAAIALDE
jgi:serine/threonine protein kinase